MTQNKATPTPSAITLNAKPSFIEAMKLSGFSVSRSEQMPRAKRPRLLPKEYRCCDMATD